MDITLERYSLIDGTLTPDPSGEWCKFDQSTAIMADAAANVYSQLSAASEYAQTAYSSTKSTKIYIDTIKAYLENVWGQ
jgi:hypothetical protein